MKFKILGSGGMYPSPVPGCFCKVCESARNGNKDDIRNMPCLYLEDIKLLIDAPEDIFNTLQQYNINDLDHISISHKDPDHARGVRIVEGMFYDWANEKPKKTIDFFALPVVVDDINSFMSNTLKFYEKVLKVIKIDACNSKVINDIKITMTNNLTNETRNVANYVFEQNGKKLIYACCNSKPFRDFDIYNNADVLIISMVDLSTVNEIDKAPYKFGKDCFSIDEVIEIKKKYNIKKIICTHLDCNWGNTSEVLKAYEKELDNIEFAFDGMEIIL